MAPDRPVTVAGSLKIWPTASEERRAHYDPGG